MSERVPYVTPGSIGAKTMRWHAELIPWLRRRPFPDLRAAALLVVDVQHAFADPAGGSYLPAVRAVLPRIRALRDAFRAAGRPVAFTRHAHRTDEASGSMARHWSWLIREGTPDARLLPESAPRRGEPVFRKRQYSAFTGTGLAAWLSRRKVGTVVATGVMTHLCVETTAREAFVREFDVLVPMDACASADETLHLGALRGLAHGFAVVTDTAMLLRRLAEAMDEAGGKRKR